ncbi:hypothetical protein SAMN02983003_0959 [Devosia enhydra]|uniref:Leucine-binding protein domain-containing protein n=1 Tax=Devosia enhydra TaxID=665118 RepID=A0A1K2HUQ5_9HYPH|nr:hypothetical protein [Devosia enhydra]SFZ82241.1 hypothetical protein SAMN02983003_0959 [Devosia enhydra]
MSRGKSTGRISGIALSLAMIGLGSGPALAQDVTTPADGSPVALVGEAILYFADAAGMDAVGPDVFNPFMIDGEALLGHAGLFFISTDFTGEEVNEGEIAIFPQFQTPFASFEAGAVTPRLIPFALKQNGVCHAGYVAGNPEPQAVYQVAMDGLACHAITVEALMAGGYAAAAKGAADAKAAIEAAGISGDLVPATPALPPVELSATAVSNFDPAFPTGLDLEVIVWAAYNAAYAQASQDGDVFARDEAAAEALRTAMLTEIRREGFEGVTIVAADSATEAKACGETGKTIVRVGFNAAGDGIVIAAVSDRRLAAQEYDPATSSEMTVTKVRDCATSGLGWAGPGYY